MICKDEAELHEEYARVIRMCKGTNVPHWKCVKLCGLKYPGKVCDFTSTPSDYSFALAIVEDRPVFEWDILYNESGGIYIAEESRWIYSGIFSTLTWNPPKKKTFPLNGDELPSPDGGGHSLYFSQCWISIEDASKVQDAFNKLLGG